VEAIRSARTWLTEHDPTGPGFDFLTAQLSQSAPGAHFWYYNLTFGKRTRPPGLQRVVVLPDRSVVEPKIEGNTR
jgi:hypothetical protein